MYVRGYLQGSENGRVVTIATCPISAYRHLRCEFESRSIHYVINFVSEFRQVGGFLLVQRFPPPIKLTATI